MFMVVSRWWFALNLAGGHARTHRQLPTESAVDAGQMQSGIGVSGASRNRHWPVTANGLPVELSNSFKGKEAFA
jgi:hypothetical protein